MTANKNVSALTSDGATLTKVIATFCVVITHSHKIFGYLGIPDSELFFIRGVRAFGNSGVPVFFLLSGFFLTVKGNFDYQKNLAKKVRSLLIPYCAFILIYACISCLGAMVLPGFFDDFRKFTAYDWLDHLFGIPFVSGPKFYGPFWFIEDLLIFNVLAFVLVPAVKKIPGFLLISVMIAVYFSPAANQLRYSIPFFLTGMYFGTKTSIPIPDNPIPAVILYTVAFTIPVAFMGSLPRKVSILLMAVSTVMISGKLAERDNIRRMAKIAIPFSFPIYATHEYPIVMSMKLLALKHISLPAAVLAYFTLPFFIIGMCVCVAIVWKRLSPKTYALCNGGRY